MIKKFAEDVYLLELPMDYSPMGNVNCYLVKGGERSLLVDTGCNTQNCRQKLEEYLAALAIDKASLDIFLTHGHIDHIGLAPFVADQETTVYINEDEYLMTQQLTDLHYWQAIQQSFTDNGWPDDAEHTFFVNAYKQTKEFKLPGRVQYICDGEVIKAAGRDFKALWTPGHTKGHMSLWDCENNTVFVGDLIVEGFYPALYYRERGLDMLTLYRQSLEKIKNTEAQLIFSGHRLPIRETVKYCDDCWQNYRGISDKVWTELNQASGDAFTLTQKIYDKKWQLYPVRKKWFCMAGVLSCLESFWLNGAAAKNRCQDITVFSPSK